MPRNEQQTSPQVLHQLSGVPITEYEHEQLEHYLEIVRNDRGCTTPIENFLKALVRSHHRRPLTPDCMRSHFEELEENWADFIADAVFTVQQYPELVRQQLPEGWTLRTQSDVEEERAVAKRVAEEAAEEAREQADKGKRAREKAAWAKRHPKEAARIQDFIEWAKTLDSESQLVAASEPHELWKSAALRSLQEENAKKKALSMRPKANKAPHSGKRGARKSSTLDEKAGTLSGSGYQVISQQKEPTRPEMPA